MDGFSKARDVRNRRRKGALIEKSRESKRNDERLYFKFIAKYVEGLHPKILADAVALHEEAKINNPWVMDKTKTVQFMSKVTPKAPIPRYYYRRQRQQQQEQQQQEMQQEMLLEIQLLTHEQTSVIMTTPSPAPVQDPEQSQDVPLPVPSPAPVQDPEQSQDVPLPVPSPAPVQDPEQSQDVPLPVPSPAPVQDPEQSQDVPLPVLSPVSQLDQEALLLPPELYIDMLREIQLDPELSQIFDDITEDNEGMNETVWNDICAHNAPMF